MRERARARVCTPFLQPWGLWEIKICPFSFTTRNLRSNRRVEAYKAHTHVRVSTEK